MTNLPNLPALVRIAAHAQDCVESLERTGCSRAALDEALANRRHAFAALINASADHRDVMLRHWAGEAPANG